jgi:hypothetical protein
MVGGNGMSNERNWTVWPPDRLAYAINTIRALLPRRDDKVIRAQINCQISIARKIKSGELDRYQGKQNNGKAS